ncbi:MAG: HEAT repeat domain-containing protein [Cyclobacteriaceae bacterium]|nr:HEAT repeat domain-containing protein [Cyclobacteriaceae bacterium]
MGVDISSYVVQLSGDLNDKAYEASDALGRIGSIEVVSSMINLLTNNNPESRFMAARTLGLIEDNSTALEPLLEAINNKGNSNQAGDLMMALEGFDLSNKYVEIFKLYLFGSFKVSLLAKELLDFKEFDINARVLKKAKKHWNHYCNNIKQDEAFQLKKGEVEELLDDLSRYLDNYC